MIVSLERKAMNRAIKACRDIELSDTQRIIIDTFADFISNRIEMSKMAICGFTILGLENAMEELDTDMEHIDKYATPKLRIEFVEKVVNYSINSICEAITSNGECHKILEGIKKEFLDMYRVEFAMR